jgi:hypothetical protein
VVEDKTVLSGVPEVLADSREAGFVLPDLPRDRAALRLQRGRHAAGDRPRVLRRRRDARPRELGGARPVVIDYFEVPDGPVPDRWPRVVGNRTEVGDEILSASAF